MAWIAGDDLESVSNASDILGTTGGSGWTGAWLEEKSALITGWQGTNTSPIQGLISGTVTFTGNKHAQVFRTVADTATGIYYVSVKMNRMSAGNLLQIFHENVTTDTIIYIKIINGNLQSFDPAAPGDHYVNHFTGLTANTTYRIGVDFDTSTGVSMNLNNGAWSTRVPNAQPGTGLNVGYFRIYAQTTDGTSGDQFWFDHLGPNYDSRRYWVGGTGAWDASTTHWSLLSGGTAGEKAPSQYDDIYINLASESGATTITIQTVDANCKSLDCTGYTKTLTKTANLNIYGSLTLVSAMTFSGNGSPAFLSTSTGNTVTMAGKTFGSTGVNFNGVGGSWTLQDALNQGGNTFILTAGTLDTNGQTVSCGNFSSSNSNVRSLVLGSSVFNCSNAWTCTTATNLTIVPGTSVIKVTGTNTFNGGGASYGKVEFNSIGVMTIAGNNTFTEMSRGAGIGAGQLGLPSGGTQTISSWTCFGSSGNLLTLNAGGGTSTISMATGLVYQLYTDITGVNVGGGSTWRVSTGSVYHSGTGWQETWGVGYNSDEVGGW